MTDTLFLSALHLIFADESRSQCGSVADAVASGDLYSARRSAVHFCQRRAIAFTIFGAAEDGDDPLNSDLTGECVRAWRDSVDALLVHDDGLTRIDEAHRQYHIARAPASNYSEVPESEQCEQDTQDSSFRLRWTECCSSLRPTPTKAGCHSRCCVLGNHSHGHLILPALREVSLTLLLPSGSMMAVEQDGFLRPFDMPTVLWPAGYLLANWVADPHERHLWRVEGRRARVIDLGTGTGAVAVAAALTGKASVLATDVAARSLALAVANGALAGTPLEVLQLDWEDAEQVERVAARGPFDLVTGAALQFERWEAQLWYVLERLTAAADAADQGGSLVALSHTVGSLQPPAPSAAFRELRRVPGTAYGMQTRWSDSQSDFEILLARRKPKLRT